MANNRWDHARMMLQETDLAEVHRWLEKELMMEEVNTPTHEYFREHAAEVMERNYKLLWEVVNGCWQTAGADHTKRHPGAGTEAS